MAERDYTYEFQYNDGSWKTISNDVYKIGRIPISYTNPDLSLTVRGFKFNLNDWATNIPDVDDEIRIRYWIDVTQKKTLYEGIIVSKVENTTKDSYDYEVVSSLSKLKAYIVDSDTLDSLITANSGYGTDGYYSSIFLIDLIGLMMNLAGLSYGFAFLNESDKYVVKNKAIKEASPTADDNRDFLFRDIKIDPYMLYLINQSVSVGYLANMNSTYADNRITCFDFMSYIFQKFNISMGYQRGTYTVTWLGNSDADDLNLTGYSIDDDLNFKQSLEDEIRNKVDAWGTRVLSEDRINYNNPAWAETDLVEVSTQKSGATFEKENIEILNGMVFLLRDEKSGTYRNVLKWEKSGTFEINIITADDGIFAMFEKKYLTNERAGKKYVSTLDQIFNGDAINNSTIKHSAIYYDIDKLSGEITEYNFN